MVKNRSLVVTLLCLLNLLSPLYSLLEFVMMVSLMILCGKFDFLHFVLQKDAKLDNKEHEGQEVLHVRAYGSSFLTLGINIRFYLYLFK